MGVGNAVDVSINVVQKPMLKISQTTSRKWPKTISKHVPKASPKPPESVHEDTGVVQTVESQSESYFKEV